MGSVTSWLPLFRRTRQAVPLLRRRAPARSICLFSSPAIAQCSLRCSSKLRVLCIAPLALFVALASTAIWAADARTNNATSPKPVATEPAAGEVPPLARAQGSSESAVLDWVLDTSGPLKGDTRVGAYRVAFTITPSEGWWDMGPAGSLVWHDAPPNAVHLRVFVMDRSDGREVHGLTVVATLLDDHGNEQPTPIAFGWYPLINAYGGNVSLSSDGGYRLRVSIIATTPRTTPPSPGDASKQQNDIAARLTAVVFPEVNIRQGDVKQLALATETGFANDARLLKPRNDALSAAITSVWQQSSSGAEKATGDYFVAYALDDTSSEHGLAVLRKSFATRETTPVEVLVRDSRTGRPIPLLSPHVRLVSADNTPFDGGKLTPVRRPWLNVYGRNLHVPRKGSYKLRVWFDAPSFRRWGRHSQRFAQAAEVEFDGLQLGPEAEY